MGHARPSRRKEGTAWKSKPSWYIVWRNDRAFDPDLQRFFAKRMKPRPMRPTAKMYVPPGKLISRKQCCSYSERRKSYWIDCRQHNFGLRSLLYLFSSFWNQTFHKISICETRAKNTEVELIVGRRGKCFPSVGSESVLIPQAGTRLHYAPTPSQMIGRS
jgi:hypothetical protein